MEKKNYKNRKPEKKVSSRKKEGTQTQRRDHGKAQGAGIHLEVKEGGLQRDQNCEKLNFYCFSHPVLCYGSPSKLRHVKCGKLTVLYENLC